MRRIAVIAAVVFALACTALLPASASGHTSASASAYLCAYGKRFVFGKVYIALAIAPRSVGPTFCRNFNKGWRGTRIRHNHELGTGVAYCAYSRSTATASVTAAIFANRKSAGKTFCALWHPRGWHRVR